MNNLNKILWGIALIIIGIILGINMLGIANINIFFDGWWTLFIIVPSFIGLFSKDSKLGNIIALIFGISLLLVSQNIISFNLIAKMIIPFILIIVGFSLVFNEITKKNITEKVKEKDINKLENIIATFSEQKVNKSSEQFEGANIDVVFGGVTLDLTLANIEEVSIIKASSIFGGIKILVPEDVNVKVKSTLVFGDVDNKIKNNKTNKKVIYIDLFCMFGGVDIK